MFCRINVTGHLKAMYFITLHGTASYCIFFLVKVWRQCYFKGVEACKSNSACTSLDLENHEVRDFCDRLPFSL